MLVSWLWIMDCIVQVWRHAMHRAMLKMLQLDIPSPFICPLLVPKDLQKKKCFFLAFLNCIRTQVPQATYYHFLRKWTCRNDQSNFSDHHINRIQPNSRSEISKKTSHQIITHICIMYHHVSWSLIGQQVTSLPLCQGRQKVICWNQPQRGWKLTMKGWVLLALSSPIFGIENWSLIEKFIALSRPVGLKTRYPWSIDIPNDIQWP